MVKDCARAIEWYKQALGAKELSRAMAPDGTSVWHASLKIGDSVFFMNDPDPKMDAGYRGPAGQMWIYGPKVDARWERAIAAGAKPKMPVWDAFWGDRMGVLVDPFGQEWCIAEHKVDMTRSQMQKATDAFIAKMKEQPQSAAV